MTAATLAGRPDPFVDVLDSLSKVAQSVSGVNQPITEVQHIVSVVDGVLVDLDRVPTLLAGIDGLLEGLRALLLVLDAVPFVDAVALACTEVVSAAQTLVTEATASFDSVDTSVIKPCRTAFDDLNRGLVEAQTVVGAISTTIPDQIRTLEILHYMAEIAAPLTGILQGSEPADKLGDLLDTLDGVQEAVGAQLAPLTGFLDGLATVVSDVVAALNGVFEDMDQTMSTVQQDLQSVEDVFSPVVDAFNKVADAITPIRWALDAISWIFDTVCEPIIQGILDATGLQAVVNDLESSVEARIGIKPILDLVQANMNSTTADGWTNQGGAKAADAGQNAWTRLSGALERYNTRDNGGFRNDLDLLIGAVASTPINPDKPVVIPDWPGQPPLDVTAPAPVPRSVGAAASTATAPMPLRQALRAQRTTGPFQALAAIPNPVPAAPRVPAASVLAAAPATGGVSSLETLRDLATQTRADLAAAAQLGPSLVADLASYDAARTLPADFRLSMQDLSDLFNDGVQALTFLEQFDFLTRFIEDLKAPLAAQATALDGILAECDGLARSGSTMDAVVNGVIAAVPSAALFTASLDYMDRVALGAASLSRAMAQARTLDAGLGNAHKADLDALESQLNTSAAAVTAQTTKVRTLAAKPAGAGQTGETGILVTAGETVLTTLGAYAAALGTLSSHAHVVSAQALPNLTSGVHLLNTLTSILDPLSGLLRQLDCVDGSDPVKAGAATAINTFKASASTVIDGQDQALRALFGAVLDSITHSDGINADIQAVNALVQADQAAFDQAGKDLAAALAGLADAMKPTQVFTFTGKDGNTVSVANLFVDAAFASKAQQVFNDVQTAAIGAKLIPPVAPAAVPRAPGHI